MNKKAAVPSVSPNPNPNLSPSLESVQILTDSSEGESDVSTTPFPEDPDITESILKFEEIRDKRDQDSGLRVSCAPDVPNRIRPIKWRLAYRFWINSYAFQHVDKNVQKFLLIDEPQINNWLVQARQALQLSTLKVAKKMSVTQSQYSRLERREINGQITLEQMRRAAEAMDCEFI